MGDTQQTETGLLTTMSEDNTTILDEERLEAVHELRKAVLCLYLSVPEDIARDVQRRAETVIALCYVPAKPDFYETLNLKLSQASERAASAMRDKCVEKVKSIADKFERSSFAESGNQRLIEKTRIDTARAIADALETLDQVEQKK